MASQELIQPGGAGALRTNANKMQVEGDHGRVLKK
jgi:hypothetical protein